MRRTALEWTFEPGVVLRGDLRCLEGARPDSAVVVVHGFKGFKDWGFFPHVCERLARDGHAVVSFNFSHNGIGDDPLEFTELERFARNTLSRELDELLFIIDGVEAGELPTGAPSRIGVLGHSRGGGQAILAASEHDGVDSLVTWAAVADFDRWDDETKGEWRERGRITVANARTGQDMPLDLSLLEDFEENRERLDIGRAAGEVSVPWLVVHGLDDGTVVPGEGHRLVERASGAGGVFVDGAGHTFEARHPFQGAPPQLQAALDATVGHFRRTLPVG